MKDKEITERRRVTVREDLPPNIVITLGSQLFYADFYRGDPKNSALWKSACTGVENYNKTCECFSPQTPDGVYCNRIRQAATKLAHGLASRARDCDRKIKMAEKRETQMNASIFHDERQISTLFGGVKLLIIGGIGFFLTRIFIRILIAIELLALNDQATAIDLRWAPIATALGFTLLGFSVKSKMIHRRILEISNEKDAAISRAIEGFKKSLEFEYWMAVHDAWDAWKCLTGEEPPIMYGSKEEWIRGLVGGMCERHMLQSNKTDSD